MSVSRGPHRIVLLRSGVYDYAELELYEPIHLISANNIGKTSLIAALQFLYIDDSRQMHFSKDWAETRRYYFPENGSLVLFECMTPTGYQVVGLRGLGPVQGFEFERFIYSGEYRRDDYLAGRQPRAWDEVARRLVDRDLRTLEPRHLRASLTGSGEMRGAALGLVPLKRSGSYESFRFLFRNLLRLSRIDQKELKGLFIDIARPQLRKTEVDLRKDYAELFARVDRQAGEVEELRGVEPTISELVTAHVARGVSRRRLTRLWAMIERTLEASRSHVELSTRSLSEALSALRDEEVRIKGQQDAAIAEGNRLSNKAGSMEGRRNELLALRDKARSFVPELETPIREKLQRELDDLVVRLQTATQADGARIQRQLDEVQRALREDTKLVERFGDAVVTWLRDRSGLDDRALSDVFSVLDATLLGEVLGEGRVSVLDQDEAIATVRRIADRFDEDGLAVPGLRVSRAPAKAASPLARYADVAAVKARIGESRDEESRLLRIVEDIRARAQLQGLRDDAGAKLKKAQDRLHDWDTWRTRRDELDQVNAELAALQQRTEVNAAFVVDLRESLQANTLASSQKTQQVKDIQAQFDRIRSDVNRLSAPAATWTTDAPDEPVEDQSLETLVRSYRQEWSHHGDRSKRVDELFAEVNHRTAERHLGASEDETIALLRDALAALDDRDRAVRELWASLVDGLRNAFKSLLEGVDEIRREVSRLSSALGRRQVSNLERIEVELVPQRDLLQRLKAVIDAEDAPLFAGAQGRSRAALEIQTWLKDRPRLDLCDLFDLRFKVVDAREQVKSFDSLAQIESQGTSTTIKVLVHLELLRAMLSDDAVMVPFYLDEVATLDMENLRALIDHASHMGFVPVVASPHAQDCVDTLYFLRPGRGGRLVLDETSRMKLRRERTDGA